MSQNKKPTDKKSLVLQETNKQITSLIASKLEAMPRDFNQTRFIQNAMTVLIDTKGIENCKPISVARTLLKGAFLGLDFLRKECYAIPYGSDLNFQTDYKGDVKLAKKYSVRPIKTIYAKVVRDGDVYKTGIKENGEQYVTFEPLSFNNGDLKGAFAVVVFVDGEVLIEDMSSQEIEDVRNNFSKSKNSLMWTKTPTEAYKKTVLRRLTKMITLDFDNIEQKQSFDDGGDLDFDKEVEGNAVKNPFEEYVDTEFEEISNAEINVDKNTGEVIEDGNETTEKQQDKNKENTFEIN